MQFGIIQTNQQIPDADVKVNARRMLAVAKRIGWVVAAYNHEGKAVLFSPDGENVEVFTDKSKAWKAVTFVKALCLANNYLVNAIGLQAVILED